jgi:alpha-methylacyl-CoA racemase
VLSAVEAPNHPHNQVRESFVTIEGQVQTATAPRFSRTPGAIQSPPVGPGANTTAILEGLGMHTDEIISLVECGAVSGS